MYLALLLRGELQADGTNSELYPGRLLSTVNGPLNELGTGYWGRATLKLRTDCSSSVSETLRQEAKTESGEETANSGPRSARNSFTT